MGYFTKALRGIMCILGLISILLMLPKLFNIEPAVVLSGSMSPALQKGDLIYTVRTDNYQVGDIISFRYRGMSSSSTHRIISIDNDGNYYTKGDNNRVADMSTITYDQIEGKVVSVICKLGYGVIWSQTRSGRLFLLALVAYNLLTVTGKFTKIVEIPLRRRKRILSVLFGVFSLSVVTVSGSFAYFSDNEVYTSKMEIGNVLVDLVANGGISGKRIQPNDVLELKPYVVNSGSEDAIVFMEIIVPAMDNLIVVSDTGVRVSNHSRNVYEFLNLSSDWIFLENRGYDASGKYDSSINYESAGAVAYVYGYNQKLSSGSQTSPLLESLKTINFSEQSMGEWSGLTVSLRTYAIQSDYISGATNPEGISTSVEVDVDNLNRNSLQYILNTFTRQNYNDLIRAWGKDAENNGKLRLDGTAR